MMLVCHQWTSSKIVSRQEETIRWTSLKTHSLQVLKAARVLKRKIEYMKHIWNVKARCSHTWQVTNKYNNCCRSHPPPCEKHIKSWQSIEVWPTCGPVEQLYLQNERRMPLDCAVEQTNWDPVDSSSFSYPALSQLGVSCALSDLKELLQSPFQMFLQIIMVIVQISSATRDLLLIQQNKFW